MDEKVKEQQDVLLVKTKQDDSLKVVTGMDEKGELKTVPPRKEHEKDFMKIDVSVSAMAYCLVVFSPLPLPSNNNIMNALPLFAQIVEDYKLYLREDLDCHQSFSKFIRPYHARYDSLIQWMRRHGVSVLQLQYDALLAKCGTDREAVLAHLGTHLTVNTPPVVVKSSGKLPEDKLLSRVIINFPDGMRMSMNAASPVALYDFINRYNHLLDKQDVRIG